MIIYYVLNPHTHSASLPTSLQHVWLLIPCRAHVASRYFGRDMWSIIQENRILKKM